MRVSISPSGSFIFVSSSLPARLHHARNLALARQLAQHVSAHAQLAVIAARATRQLAAVAHAGGGGVARQLRELQPGRKALLDRLAAIVGQRLELLALGRILPHQLLAPVVLVDRTLLGHLILRGLSRARPAFLSCETGS